MNHDEVKLVNSDETSIFFYQAIRKMNRLFFVLSVFALSFFLFACATVPSTRTEKKTSVAEKTQTLDELLKNSHYKMGLFFDELVEKRKEDKKVFKVGYDEVFNALVEIMSDIGNPVLSMDKVNGLIVTDEERRSYYFETWQDKYSLKVTKLSQAETQVSVKRTVKKKEGRDRAGRDIWTDKASDGVIENWILSQIEQKTLKAQSSPQPVKEKTEVKPSVEKQLPQSANEKTEVKPSGKMQLPQSAKEEVPPASTTPIPKIAPTEFEAIFVITTKANFRSEPNDKCKIISKLEKGDKVVKLGISGNWLNVKLPSGLTGWVFKEYVKEVK